MPAMLRHAIFLAALWSTQALAGPFGLEMGTSSAALKKQLTFVNPDDKFGIYRTKSMPSGHPDMETYQLLAPPTTGLCKITALSKKWTTSIYGSELIERFDALEKALSAKYGQPADEFDFLRAGSMWKEDDEWMMGLLKKERILTTFWNSKKQALPDNIGSISLEAQAASTSQGWIILSYEFTNIDACMDSIDQSKNSSL